MKKWLFAMIINCTFSIAVSAQNQQAARDQKDVAAAVETLKKAMVDANKQQLENITAPELSYGHSSGKIEDKAAFVDALVSGRNDFLTMDITELTIKIVGNTALVRHRLGGNVNDGGVPGTVKLGVLLVWQKQGGKWKLLARQAYKL